MAEVALGSRCRIWVNETSYLDCLFVQEEASPTESPQPDPEQPPEVTNG